MRHALDLLAVTGLGLLVYGVDQIYRPAAFIVGGLVLFVGAVLAHLNSPRPR